MLQFSSHVWSVFSLFPRALSLLYFIEICLILHLIKSHRTLLSVTALNSINHPDTLSVNSATKFVSSTRLALSFQNEGPFLRGVALSRHERDGIA